jgi:hypothetical protein
LPIPANDRSRLGIAELAGALAAGTEGPGLGLSGAAADIFGCGAGTGSGTDCAIAAGIADKPRMQAAKNAAGLRAMLLLCFLAAHLIASHRLWRFRDPL